jgi:hypothetical protein
MILALRNFPKALETFSTRTYIPERNPRRLVYLTLVVSVSLGFWATTHKRLLGMRNGVRMFHPLYLKTRPPSRTHQTAS